MQPKLIQNFRHRPEVDGLRALAVGAVVLFHAGLGLPGGYVGVDVFFVISGFLITSLILRDLENDRFSLVEFWERRARRIVPAAAVMVLATLAAGWFLLLPSDYVELAKSAIAQTFFAANVFFWRSSDYFSGAAEEMPLLHTWSLAVEEQFYLFVPLLLLVLFRWHRFRGRAMLVTIIGTALLTSLTLSIYAVPRIPGAAFYLLPTRAWELLFGSLVAVFPGRSRSFSSVHNVIAWAGLAAIIVPFFAYSAETPFPGLAALPICLGTAFFIWAADSRVAPTAADGNAAANGNATEQSRRPWWQRFPQATTVLSYRPVVFVGLISYSLYLWHWPVLAFTTYWTLEPLPIAFRIGLVMLSLLLAVLSWRFIETPFRVRTLGASRRAIFTYSGLGFATTVVFAFMIIGRGGEPTRFSPRLIALHQVKADELALNRRTPATPLSDAIEGNFPVIGNRDSNQLGLMVWGDSHAGAILSAVEQVADQAGAKAAVAWFSLTPPVLDYHGTGKHSLGKDAARWNRAVFDFVIDQRIPNVLMAGRWSEHFDNDTANTELGKALVATVKKLRDANVMVWVLDEVPGHRVGVPKAFIVAETLGIDPHAYACDVAHRDIQTAALNRWKTELIAAGAGFLDVSAKLFDPAAGHYRMESDGQLLYYDEHHLTAYGARSVGESLAPIFSATEPVIAAEDSRQLVQKNEPQKSLQSVFTTPENAAIADQTETDPSTRCLQAR
jgi:peptidoglycan/LPS O-acetylase OafA/YrhL